MNNTANRTQIMTYNEKISQLINSKNDFHTNSAKFMEDTRNIYSLTNFKSIKEKFNELKLLELKLREITKLLELQISSVTDLIEHELNELSDNISQEYHKDKNTLIKLQIERERLEIIKLGGSGNITFTESLAKPFTKLLTELHTELLSKTITEQSTIKPPLVYKYFKSVANEYYYQCEESLADIKCLVLKCNRNMSIYNFGGVNCICGCDVNINNITILPNKQLLFSYNDNYTHHVYKNANAGSHNVHPVFDCGKKHKFDNFASGIGTWYAPKQNANDDAISSVFKLLEFSQNTALSNEILYYDIVVKTQYTKLYNHNHYSHSPCVKVIHDMLMCPNVYIKLTCSFDGIESEKLSEIFGSVTL